MKVFFLKINRLLFLFGKLSKLLSNIILFDIGINGFGKLYPRCLCLLPSPAEGIIF